MSHGRVVCKDCQEVLMTCRCPQSHEVTYVVCDKCEEINKIEEENRELWDDLAD